MVMLLRLVFVVQSLLSLGAVKIHNTRRSESSVEVDVSSNLQDVSTSKSGTLSATKSPTPDSLVTKRSSKSTKKKSRTKTISLRNHLLEVLLSGN